MLEFYSSLYIFLGIIGLPLVGFLVMSVLLLLGHQFTENKVVNVIRTVMIVHFATVIYCTFVYAQADLPVTISLGHWYEVGDYKFDLTLLLDRISVFFLTMTSFLLNVVGHFCTRYLHRDKGFFRFCALYLLFSSGISIVIFAGSIDLLFVGWELLGLSSALLISYYHERHTPAFNGFYTYIHYRICDAFLLAAAVLWHYFASNNNLSENFSHLNGLVNQHHDQQLVVLAGVLIIASLAKSAQFPFNNWLPKAMEGPTPSSAIFYGALSIHAGAYLLLRCYPVIECSELASWLIVIIGLVSVAYAHLVGKTRSDVKSLLAYAAMAQVGLIYVEIGMGWLTLAIVHMMGHSLLRALQFLRAPSVLHDVHQMGREPLLYHLFAFEKLLPRRTQKWLYRQAMTAEDTFDAVLFLGPLKWLFYLKLQNNNNTYNSSLENDRCPQESAL